MKPVNITTLRQALPDYIKQVQAGETVEVSVHGRVVAHIIPAPQADAREQARQRLQALRGTMIRGDLLAPVDEVWSGDADHL